MVFIMAKHSICVTPELEQYMLDRFLQESPALQQLRTETQRLGNAANMMISPLQGQFIALLIKATAAKRILELGTFTGYSTLWMAQAVEASGQIITCDINKKTTQIAEEHWEKARVNNRIELKCGVALEVIEQALLPSYPNYFDMIFIDADKANIVKYYEYAILLVRSGGLILIDNVLWDGAVLDNLDLSKQTAAICALNEKVKADARVEISILPLGNSMLLARKKHSHYQGSDQ